jgi:hypothetical protein
LAAPPRGYPLPTESSPGSNSRPKVGRTNNRGDQPCQDAEHEPSIICPRHVPPSLVPIHAPGRHEPQR